MITLIKNDISTPLLFTAKSGGNVIPLVGSEVFFDFIFKATNKRVAGGKCDIVDVGLGTVKYIFKEGELSQVGEYQGRVRLDLTQGAHREALTLEMQIVEVPVEQKEAVAPVAPVQEQEVPQAS